MTGTPPAGRRQAFAVLLGALTLTCAAAGLWLVALTRDVVLPPGVDTPGPVYLLGWLVFAAMGFVLARRAPGNPVGWTLLLGGLTWLLGGLAGAYRTYVLLVHAGLPWAGGASIVWDWAYLPGMVAVLLLLLVFPDGRFLSPRWRLVAGLLVAAAVTVGLGLGVQPGPLPNTPEVINAGVEWLAPLSDTLVAFGNFVFALGALAAFVSLMLRYRRAGSVERHQIKWFAYAATLLIAALLAAEVLQRFGASPEVLAVVRTAPMLLLPVAIAAAVLQLRLYDIDVVISRSLVYTVLAVFIGLVYVGVIVGLGTLIGARETVDVPLSITATVLVAVAFAPVRAWAQRLADQLVYGRRDSPYEILASFAPRVTSVHPEGGVLTEMAHVVAEAVGGAYGEVWLRAGQELRCSARWPDPGGGPEPAVALPANGALALPGADRVYPVRSYGRLVGALAVGMPRGASIRPADDVLLTDLASAAWLVLDNVELIGELRASRQRLVTAQDAERARIERDLHDGAQQRLLELALTISTARNEAESANARAAVETMDRAQEQLRGALSELRELARGIHPAILSTRGLRPALEALAERAPLPVVLAVADLARLPGPVEATAYFVTAEALTNVVKHAHATEVRVAAECQQGMLRLTVIDDGVGGADPEAPGLRGLADRVLALDGRLIVASPAGQGTRLEVELPCG